MGKLKFNSSTKRATSNTPTSKPKSVIMYPAGIHDGCTAWRMDWVRTALNYNKIAQVQMTNIIQPLYVDAKQKGSKMISPLYIQSDAIVLQRPTQDQQITTAKHLQNCQNMIKQKGKSPFRFIIDVDDVVHGDHISQFNAARKGYADNKRFETFKKIVKYSDELHVCSPAMVDYYQNELEFDNVTFRPNLMPKHLFDVFYNPDELQRRYIKHAKKPRIVWAGSATHVDVANMNNGVDDFTHIKDFVKKTVDKYQWVFMGASPKWIEQEYREGKVEVHKWIPISDYAYTLWNLEPTIIFAPLHDDIFNRCKSNIKLTEAGIMGIAGVFQDLEPYKDAPLKFKTSDELSDHINFLLSDWNNYDIISKQMRNYSEGYLLENNFNILKASYFTDINSKEREMLSKKLIDIQKNV